MSNENTKNYVNVKAVKRGVADSGNKWEGITTDVMYKGAKYSGMLFKVSDGESIMYKEF